MKERLFSNFTKAFLSCVLPPIAVAAIVAFNCWTGRMPAVVMLVLMSVWLVAAVWGYADWNFRRLCRRAAKPGADIETLRDDTAD